MIRKPVLLKMILVVTVLLLVVPVLASHFISFPSPVLTGCNLTNIVITGTHVVSAGGDADVRYSETINGIPTGSGDFADSGTFTFYPFDTFVVGGYPYSFTAIWTVESRATGNILEQYQLTGTCTAASTGTVSFSEIVSPAATANVDSTVYPPDNRINWQYGDLHAVLYRSTNSQGNPAIDVYCYNGENSWLGMRVSEANAVNGLSANGCNATFYVLPDGGYQFNINYDDKLYEIECADFDCNPPEMRYFDPNE